MSKQLIYLLNLSRGTCYSQVWRTHKFLTPEYNLDISFEGKYMVCMSVCMHPHIHI